MKRILSCIFFIISITTFSQTQDIYYDVSIDKFEEDITILNNGTKGNIYVKHFNPFMYNITLEKTTVDNAQKIPSFINGIAQLFGVNIGAITENFLKLNDHLRIDDDKDIQDLTNLIKLYMEVYVILKEKSLDCNKLEGLLSKIGENTLRDNYILIAQHLESISFEQVLQLDILVNNLKRYLKENINCQTKVGSYSISGEKTILKLTMTLREETRGFETPLTDIVRTKIIETKNVRKIRFSSGLFASKNVIPDYFVTKIDSVQHRISTEKKDSYMPGAIALAHYEIQDNIYANFGAGLTIEAVPHFLIGGSLIANKKKNLFINLGYGWAYINTLSDKFSVDKVYESAPTIKTKKTLKGDFWFGVSFKL